MSCRRTYIPFSPLRMAERMASLHESAVRMMAPFLVKMATLSLAPVEPLDYFSMKKGLRPFFHLVCS